MGDAVRFERALTALRLARLANRRAQIHQPLAIGGNVFGAGQKGLRQRPQPAGGRGGRYRIGNAENPAQHPLHIAVENCGAFVEAECGNRRSGGRADARQRRKLGGGARKCAAARLNDGPGTAVQVARALVVTQTAPDGEHVVQRCFSERAHRGKARNEPGEVVDDHRHLRLLQHDLGEPDAVGVAHLPGQIVPPVPELPVHQTGGELDRSAPRGGIGGILNVNGVGFGHRGAEYGSDARRCARVRKCSIVPALQRCARQNQGQCAFCRSGRTHALDLGIQPLAQNVDLRDLRLQLGDTILQAVLGLLDALQG
ncbi:hypothetical protein GALL_461000 [mine drainage metagenome]|uniref:Uncharacterized protein n=1 Tax=mine drainage metagenome TaxID=410659 RepID=A0A1J5PXI9_9ZZZZ